MALALARADLQTSLERLHTQVAGNLLWVITENRPGDSAAQSSPLPFADHYLVGRYEEVATELLGLIHAAVSASTRIQATHPGAAMRGLVECQRHVQQVAHHFYHTLSSFESLEDLTDLAYTENDGWADWVENVKVELARCHAPLDNVNGALLTCWQEIAEYIANAGTLKN